MASLTIKGLIIIWPDKDAGAGPVSCENGAPQFWGPQGPKILKFWGPGPPKSYKYGAPWGPKVITFWGPLCENGAPSHWIKFK